MFPLIDEINISIIIFIKILHLTFISNSVNKWLGRQIYKKDTRRQIDSLVIFLKYRSIPYNLFLFFPPVYVFYESCLHWLMQVIFIMNISNTLWKKCLSHAQIFFCYTLQNLLQESDRMDVCTLFYLDYDSLRLLSMNFYTPNFILFIRSMDLWVACLLSKSNCSLSKHFVNTPQIFTSVFHSMSS